MTAITANYTDTVRQYIDSNPRIKRNVVYSRLNDKRLDPKDRQMLIAYLNDPSRKNVTKEYVLTRLRDLGMKRVKNLPNTQIFIDSTKQISALLYAADMLGFTKIDMYTELSKSAVDYLMKKSPELEKLLGDIPDSNREQRERAYMSIVNLAAESFCNIDQKTEPEAKKVEIITFFSAEYIAEAVGVPENQILLMGYLKRYPDLDEDSILELAVTYIIVNTPELLDDLSLLQDYNKRYEKRMGALIKDSLSKKKDPVEIAKRYAQIKSGLFALSEVYVGECLSNDIEPEPKFLAGPLCLTYTNSSVKDGILLSSLLMAYRAQNNEKYQEFAAKVQARYSQLGTKQPGKLVKMFEDVAAVCQVPLK